MKRCQQCRFPFEGRLAGLIGRVARIKASTTHPGLCTRCAATPSGTRAPLGARDYICQICHRKIDEKVAMTHVKAEEYLLGLIKRDHPEWRDDQEAVAYYRELIKTAEI
jgi:hypothetical protein